jgi:O-antigen biosynthesis protein
MRLLRRKLTFEPRPAAGATAAGAGVWQSSGGASFDLVHPRGRVPTGWVLVRIETDARVTPGHRPILDVDSGSGFADSGVRPLPLPHEGRLEGLVHLPTVVRALRLRPMERPGTFRLGEIALREITRAELAARMAAPVLRELVRNPRRLPVVASRALGTLRRGGLRAVRQRLLERSRSDATQANYVEWVKEYDTLSADDRTRICRRVEALPRKPLLSVIVPTYRTPERWLRRAIASVREQLYPHWELCIADDASPEPHVRAVLAEEAAADSRIRFDVRATNGHISEASNTALAMARGDYAVLLDHDDELAPHALYLVAEELNEHPGADLLYSDEDKIDEDGVRYSPYFKPDWNPDLIGSQNFFSHLGVYRLELLRKIGGFRKGLEGSQDYDLVLRCLAETSADRVRHVPHVLYHWRAVRGSTATGVEAKEYATAAAERALRDAYALRDARIEVRREQFPGLYRVRWPLPDPAPLVSILIPTRDAAEVLRRAVESVLTRTLYPRFELIVLDNQSADPRTHAFFEEARRDPRVRVLRWDHPFNFSAINNFGARSASGDVLCLLNNDVEVLSGDWLRELVSHAMRPEVGVAGARLLYPDRTVQHAGVVTGIHDIAGHVHNGIPAESPGYFGRAVILQNMTALTAACWAVRREVYERLGGLDEHNLPVAFNDVDFCLRAAEVGLRNVYTPYAELLHHESYSRGEEDSPEKKKRFAGEIAYMFRRWGPKLPNDPAYNPNLSLTSLHFELAWPPRAPKKWWA